MINLNFKAVSCRAALQYTREGRSHLLCGEWMGTKKDHAGISCRCAVLSQARTHRLISWDGDTEAVSCHVVPSTALSDQGMWMETQLREGRDS